MSLEEIWEEESIFEVVKLWLIVKLLPDTEMQQ